MVANAPPQWDILSPNRTKWLEYEDIIITPVPRPKPQSSTQTIANGKHQTPNQSDSLLLGLEKFQGHTDRASGSTPLGCCWLSMVGGGSHASLHISHALPSPWTAACIHVHIDIYMHATQHGGLLSPAHRLTKKKAEGVGREGGACERTAKSEKSDDPARHLRYDPGSVKNLMTFGVFGSYLFLRSQ